jgi:lysophospholipase
MITSFDDYLDDALIAHKAVSGGSKTIIFGHSMGGLIALRLVLRNPEIASALMLSAPYLKRALKASPVKIAAGHLLGKLIPKLALASGLKGEHVTHDPAEAALYDNDPLLITKVRAGWFVAAEAAMADVATRVGALSLPVYWTHGEMDPVASFEQSRMLFDKVQAKDKTFVALAGMRHEPLHEIDRAKVAMDLTAWAAKHV